MSGKDDPPASFLVVTLKGKGVQEGSLRADRLASLLDDLQNTLYRVAMVLTGTGSVGRTGAFPKEIRQTCALEFVGMRKGSVTLALDLVSYPALDEEGLGMRSISTLVEGISTFTEKGDTMPEHFDLGVLDRLHKLTGIMDEEIDQIDFQMRSRRHSKRAVLSNKHRKRLSEVVSRAERSLMDLQGTVRELDLERQKCQVYPPEGGYVRCSYPPELEGEMKRYLDQDIILYGVATTRPSDGKMREFEIREVARGASARERVPVALTARRLLETDLSGIWTGRVDILDATDYAEELRRRAERRGGS